jgi:DNA adenine methylase
MKWPGGKRELLKYILPLCPMTRGRYFEPFVGGGAVFFALSPPQAVLSDCDQDLVNCYSTIRDEPDVVVAKLAALRNTEEDYYQVRASRPRSASKRAARTIYLSKLAFNGIYRKNRNGEFNVPYGYKLHLAVCDATAIHAASTALANARIECLDFEEAVHGARAGDVVYMDPPYTVAHGNNGFVKYNAKIFSWKDQERLARVAADLARRKCRVVISNADHPSILRLYSGFRMIRIARASRIAASVDHRKSITECVFYNG